MIPSSTATILRMSICALIFLTASCQTFQTLENAPTADVAHVYVSAYPAVPWTDIADKLEPKNNLTTADARNLAAQTTQVQVSQFLSSFAIGLGLGLATKLDTTKISRANGSETTTEDITKSSGTVPTSSGVASTALGVSTLTPDLSKSPTPAGIDGNTLLTAASALYQQAQILDNQISKAVYPEGYQAHLVTLQIALQPTRRDASVDAYTDVTFLPAKFSELQQDFDDHAPVMIYPLIVMDALETTNVGRSVEAVRQASLALSGVIGAVGANLGISGGSSSADTMIGLAKNSLITVGRVADHTVRIRLGAENTGGVGLALVPRTYNVSLVVFSRTAASETDKPTVTALRAISHTTFAYAKDGTVTEANFDPLPLAGKVRGAICQFRFDGTLGGTSGLPSCTGDYVKDSKVTDRQQAIPYLDLLRSVQRSEFKGVLEKIRKKATPINSDDQISLVRLLAAIGESQVDSRYSELVVALKKPEGVKLPPEDQLVLYSDNKKSTVFTLRGGAGLTRENATPSLMVTIKDDKPKNGGTAAAPQPKSLTLLPSDVSFASGALSVTFPSLDANGLALSDDYALHVGNHRYRVRLFAAPTIDSVENPLKSSSAILVANLNDVATVTLKVDKFSDAVKAVAPLTLSVDGADIRPDTAAGASVDTGKGIAVNENSAITLSLGNLTPARPVVISTLDKAGHRVGNPIEFPVERISK